jgi:predicted dehydrogenase
MWTRFFPLFQHLQDVLHTTQLLGPIRRVFCDFGLPMNPDALSALSRLKDPSLGAGSLLDIGIYSLTWGLCCLDPGIGTAALDPDIQYAQLLSDGIDVSSSIILTYHQTRRQGILTSNMYIKTDQTFARIEGSKGSIRVEGSATSNPERFVAFFPETGQQKAYEFEKLGQGFYYEADAVALDISAGRKENATMPHAETVRILTLMDSIRKSNGALFPQDS